MSDNYGVSLVKRTMSHTWRYLATILNYREVMIESYCHIITIARPYMEYKLVLTA